MPPEAQIGVIDYGGGNIRSLIRALETLGAPPRLITAPEQMDDLEIVFFPGQGAFGDCMTKLDNLGLVKPLVDWIKADRPFFGICIGYQLLFEGSEESPGVRGLSIFQGQVTRFPRSDPSGSERISLCIPSVTLSQVVVEPIGALIIRRQ